jgi:hypothetical protein
MLRVGGRLNNAVGINFDQKHPILLPKKHEFTRLIILHEHIKNLHAGVHTIDNYSIKILAHSSKKSN